MSFLRRLKIFICYRRDDTGGYAGRLRDRLGKRYGDKNIFMDVHNIDPGDAFPRKIQDELLSCDVLIALIGKNWEGIDAVSGNSRLENPNDFVRSEITLALDNGIIVIPIIVEGSQIPEKLPSPLTELQRRNSMTISLQTFDSDIDILFQVLKKYNHKVGRRFFLVILVISAIAVMIAVLYKVIHFTDYEDAYWNGKWDYTFKGSVGRKTAIIKGHLILTIDSLFRVNGEYHNEGGRTGFLRGTLTGDGSRLDGIWTSGSESGCFYFVLQPDKSSFHGGYSAKTDIPADNNPNNFWNGIKKEN